MNNKTSGIYLIVCTANYKKYVGSAVSLKKRFWEHTRDLRNGEHHNRHLQSAWKKYGTDQFQFIVLEVVLDRQKLIEREQFWIDMLNPEFNSSRIALAPSRGINWKEETLQRRSESKKRHWQSMTPDQREVIKQKIRDGVKAYWLLMNKKERAEHIKKISNPHSPKTRALISRRVKEQFALNGNSAWGKKHPHKKGYKHSKETIKKIKIARVKQSDAQRIERERKRAEWEAGREQREAERIEKIRAANTGRKVSEETKAKLRRIVSAKWKDETYRRKHKQAVRAAMKDPEVLRRLSESHKGKSLSAEHRKKIGDLHRGMKRSAATRKRLSEARRLWWKQRKAR